MPIYAGVPSGGTSGFGPELVSGEASSDNNTPGVSVYFTDKNGNKDGQVSIWNPDGMTGGSGLGIFHAQTNDAMFCD